MKHMNYFGPLLKHRREMLEIYKSFWVFNLWSDATERVSWDRERSSFAVDRVADVPCVYWRIRSVYNIRIRHDIQRLFDLGSVTVCNQRVRYTRVYSELGAFSGFQLTSTVLICGFWVFFLLRQHWTRIDAAFVAWHLWILPKWKISHEADGIAW